MQTGERIGVVPITNGPVCINDIQSNVTPTLLHVFCLTLSLYYFIINNNHPGGSTNFGTVSLFEPGGVDSTKS